MSDFTLSTEMQNELDDLMQQGYTYSREGNLIDAVRVWGELWSKLLTILNGETAPTLQELNEALQSKLSIYNWASDYGLELSKALKEDIGFARSRIDFCTEYAARYVDETGHNVLELKRAVAETYFEIGQRAEGEQIFESNLAKCPTWGWGWISWADQYWICAEESIQDSGKAISILQQALAVKGLEDRQDVLERLNDLYTDLGMYEEANNVFQEIMEYIEANRARRMLSPVMRTTNVASVKVGRNDPCTCGSGMKYKKCCGK